jgi:transcriptional regulator with XRE-family HTH domain
MTALASYRHRAGLTQQEAAAASGHSQTALSLWESGRRTPTIESLTRLATALGLTDDELGALCRQIINSEGGE